MVALARATATEMPNTSPIPENMIQEMPDDGVIEAIESCFDAGWTDGLPVVPPSRPAVEAMLAAGPWEADEILLVEPVRDRQVSALKIAANAVMAGCRPEYFPVVGAVFQAMSDPRFNLHMPATSTGGAAIVTVVNGPIRDQLGIHYKENLLGPGFRANATIGRCVRLVLRNCLSVIPGTLDKSTQGWPGKYSCCFGEDESASPWEPFHVANGFEAEQSTVTIFAGEGCHNLLNHGSADAEGLLMTFADSMAAAGSFSPGPSLIVVAPEHAKKLEGWDRTQVQEFLYENACRTLADLKRLGKCEADDGAATYWVRSGLTPLPGDEEKIIHRGQSPEDIHIFVGGGDAGGHSAFFPSWSRGPSVPAVTYPIPG